MPQRLSALIALAENRGGVHGGGGGRGLIPKIHLEAANHPTICRHQVYIQCTNIHADQKHRTHKNNEVNVFQSWGKGSADTVGVLNTPNLS